MEYGKLKVAMIPLNVKLQENYVDKQVSKFYNHIKAMVDNSNSYKNQDDGWGLTVQMFLC